MRLLLVAGAPVPTELLQDAAALLPRAQIATPYGMTEALPLTETDVRELLVARGNGVLVGRPLPGVDVVIAPLGDDGSPSVDVVTTPDVTGEIVVRAAWMRDRYDRRWGVQEHADSPRGWHRTGDVGHLDGDGRLWVEGRLAHVITTAGGPVTPVAVELSAARAAGSPLSACAGVGPRGNQVVVVAVQAPGPKLALADLDVTMSVRERVRDETGIEVAAVVTMAELPVDVRHRSKVDRTRVAREVSVLLAGEGLDA